MRAISKLLALSYRVTSRQRLDFRTQSLIGIGHEIKVGIRRQTIAGPLF